MSIVRLLIPPAIAIALLVAFPVIGNAASCADIALEVAAQHDGELLSVTSIGDAECKIVILIKSDSGEPARKKTITVRK